MKKIKLFAPLLGIAATAGAIVPLAVSCNKEKEPEEQNYAVKLNNLTPDTSIKDVTVSKTEITQDEAKGALKIILSSKNDAALVYVTELAIGNKVLEYDFESTGDVVAEGKWRLSDDEVVFSKTCYILIGKGAITGDLTITYSAYAVSEKAIDVIGLNLDNVPLTPEVDYTQDMSIIPANWDGKIKVTLQETTSTEGKHIVAHKTLVHLVDITGDGEDVPITEYVTPTVQGNELTITFSRYAQFLITVYYRDVAIKFGLEANE